MQDLNVTIIQSDLIWENVEQNIDNFTKYINSISDNTDLIVIPEMFNTGFAMNTEKLAEDINGNTIQWMANIAKQKNCVLTGSLIIKENNHFYNSLIWMSPDGTYERYDKRHLFRMGLEHDYFTAGNKKLIVELNGWKFLPLVCYDLRFPVWSRKRFYKTQDIQAGNEYDCLIYVANWPESRSNVWKTLLAARAMENQSFVIGVNRIGKDGKDINYSGDSVVLDSYGKALTTTQTNMHSVETVTLSYNKLLKHRENFSVGLDSDEFQIL